MLPLRLFPVIFGFALFSQSDVWASGALELNSELQKGLSAYQSQQFAQAREHFQALLGETGNNPGLLHNLALSLYQLDQKPMALALWRKALSIDPTFRPARTGRDLLEAKMQMRPFERDAFSLNLHRTLKILTLPQWMWINALLFLMLGIFCLRYWASRRTALEEARPLPPFPVLPLLLFLGFFLSGAAVALKFSDELYSRATVTVKQASARSLPTEEAVGLFELSGGTEVLIKRQQQGWVQVQNSEGVSGWVKNSEIFVTSGHASDYPKDVE